jgi:pseudouridine-5'-phosphate glycosidase
MLDQYLDINPEVRQALDAGKAVVALESTIISHGMPYPRNVETALRVEQIVRENGAIPATIAIMNGKLKVGLTREEIESLGKSHDVIKTSRRDIPFILSQGLDGATTVASTMVIASLAKINIFATGGIGGVHRGAPETFDISADLLELSQTDVAVVCAGVKSILDIGLTLEYLETQGVPVIGYGTDELPAFYTSRSGFAVDYRIDTPKEIAGALKTKWDLGLKGGAVVANPIPAAYEMDPEVINRIIDAAIKDAELKGIKGKETTPFLLAKVTELTKGSSLDANIQLVYNNAKVGAQIAVAFSQL